MSALVERPAVALGPTDGGRDGIPPEAAKKANKAAGRWRREGWVTSTSATLGVRGGAGVRRRLVDAARPWGETGRQQPVTANPDSAVALQGTAELHQRDPGTKPHDDRPKTGGSDNVAWTTRSRDGHLRQRGRKLPSRPRRGMFGGGQNTQGRAGMPFAYHGGPRSTTGARHSRVQHEGRRRRRSP